MNEKKYNIFKSWPFYLVLFLYFGVSIFNDGFMALDEYWVGINRYIPAQTASVAYLVQPDDVKSPLQLLPMHIVSQIAYNFFGVEAPYWQYRSVIGVLGILNTLLLLVSLLNFIKINKFNEKNSKLLLLMMAFYFAAPFTLTRPMYEAVAAPWLLLAATWTLKYYKNNNLKDLLWAVLFVSMAFVLRQQLGICALVILGVVILKKEWKHFFISGALGLLFFILSGIPDYFLRGKFHYSLLSLTMYNVEHGKDYGDRGIWFYPVLIFIMVLGPFFIAKYPKIFLKQYFYENKILLAFLGAFVFLHSLFPNKWERFIISVIPFLILLMYPFFSYLLENFRKYKFRLLTILCLNLFLFTISSFFPAQKNLIEMSLYLNEHPEIKTVYRYQDVPGWITEVFIKDKKFHFSDFHEAEQVNSVDWRNCSNSLVLSEEHLPLFSNLLKSMYFKAEFNVNYIEQLSYKFNPEKNKRRVPLKIYTGCPS